MSAGLADENLLMLAAYDGVYLIQLDVDEWGWKGAAPGLETEVIPAFFRLDQTGKPTGDKINGGAWEEDTYENITRVMGPWFHKP